MHQNNQGKSCHTLHLQYSHSQEVVPCELIFLCSIQAPFQHPETLIKFQEQEEEKITEIYSWAPELADTDLHEVCLYVFAIIKYILVNTACPK